jgi:hypothetical protein
MSGSESACARSTPIMSIGNFQRMPTPTEYSSGVLQSLNALPMSAKTAARKFARRSLSNSMLATILFSPPPLSSVASPMAVPPSSSGGLRELTAKPRTLRSPPAKKRCEAGSCENSLIQVVPNSPRLRRYQGPPLMGQTRSARA